MRVIGLLLLQLWLVFPALGDELDVVREVPFRMVTREMLSEDLSDTLPLFENAEFRRFSFDSGTPALVCVFDRPARDVLKEIVGEHGEVACDCALFVQLAAQLMSGKDERAILLPTRENLGGVVEIGAGERNDGNGKLRRPFERHRP